MEKIKFFAPGECWEWTGSKDKTGRAKFRLHGESTIAARTAYLLANGEFDRSCLILHTCDNPSCVNPEHLFLGTHRDNMIDMTIKGRGITPYSGITHCKYGHKFTPENTIYRDKPKGRRCRICRDKLNRINNAKRKSIRTKISK